MRWIRRLKTLGLWFAWPSLVLCTLATLFCVYLWFRTPLESLGWGVFGLAEFLRLGGVMLALLASAVLVLWFVGAGDRLHRRGLHPRGALGVLAVLIGLPVVAAAGASILAELTGVRVLFLLALPAVFRAWSELDKISESAGRAHGVPAFEDLGDVERLLGGDEDPDKLAEIEVLADRAQAYEPPADWGFGFWVLMTFFARACAGFVPRHLPGPGGVRDQDPQLLAERVNETVGWAAGHALFFGLAMWGAISALRKGTERMRLIEEAAERLENKRPDPSP